MQGVPPNYIKVNNMKKLILVTALGVSFSSFAAPTFDLSSDTVIYTDISVSKAEAYETGVETLQQLQQLTGIQAYQKLNLVYSHTAKNSIKIGDGRVYVDEFADADGTLKYQARVKLTYSYKESGNNR